MTIVTMSNAIESSRPGGLGAFNVIQLEHAEAIATGAESAGRPVVLQISENTVIYHGSLAPLTIACLRIAAESSADVVVHLDHASDAELVEEAVGLGVGSVMYDASAMPHDANVASTAAVARWCRRRGVWVEAELGEVGGKDGAHAPGVRTDPAEAAAYVEATGVDALAVAVGSSHAMLTRDAELDNELIAAIAASVRVPLVLHGSSGVPDGGIAAAVAHGMVKINLATRLNQAMTTAVRAALGADDTLVDPRKYLGPGRESVAGEVTRLLSLLSG
ncbi:MAG: class II fructose-bisphosphate aldolase family protein [Nocardioidaceae bacterium]|nr:class II fructose-bisphosphate aldolase family protein [Nocardioidaceae bacterium]